MKVVNQVLQVVLVAEVLEEMLLQEQADQEIHHQQVLLKVILEVMEHHITLEEVEEVVEVDHQQQVKVQSLVLLVEQVMVEQEHKII